jgi:hypothetical protein
MSSIFVGQLLRVVEVARLIDRRRCFLQPRDRNRGADHG